MSCSTKHFHGFCACSSTRCASCFQAHWEKTSARGRCGPRHPSPSTLTTVPFRLWKLSCVIVSAVAGRNAGRDAGRDAIHTPRTWETTSCCRFLKPSSARVSWFLSCPEARSRGVRDRIGWGRGPSPPRKTYHVVGGVLACRESCHQRT